MSAKLENTTVVTGLEKVSFHSSPKEGQCQRMFKLPHNCTHFTHQQGNTQNPSSQASIVCELRAYRYTSWIQKNRGTRDQIANILWSIEKTREFQKNIYFCFIDYTKAFDCLDPNKLWEMLRNGNSGHFTCLLGNLREDQEATVRTKHGTTNWLKIRKGIHAV